MVRWVSLLALLLAASACAQRPPDRGLLDAREPANWRGVFHPERVNDGRFAVEGEAWDSERAANLAPLGAGLVYDLGRSSTIATIFLQASADEAWRVDVSDDRHAWSLAWVAPTVPGSGLASRRVTGLRASGRYLRVRPEGGDGRIGLAELEVHAGDVSARVGREEAGRPRPDVLAELRAQSLRKVPVGLLALAALALLRRRARGPSLALGAAALALGVSAWWTFGKLLAVPVAAAVTLAGARRVDADRTRRLTLLALVLTAAMAWTNFGRFAGYWSVHYHDAMHYFLGAKYAPELGYTRLYHCVAAADVDERRWIIPPDRLARDLRDDRVVPFEQLVRERAYCTDRFTPSRWAAFRADVAFFQSQLSPRAWGGWFTDHGYNATPVWTWLFRALVIRDAPASAALLGALAHLDELFYASLIPLTIWGFGLELGALALLVFALGFPWVSMWVGGGIGRAPWLVATVAAVALARRGRPLAAGASIGLAATLLAFPALLAFGPASACAAAVSQRRPPPREDLRLCLGAALVGALLLGPALASLGVSALEGFLANSAKHVEALANNRLGLLTALSLAGLPHAAAKLVGLACFAVVLAWTARARTTWERVAIASLAPFMLFELSSYYGALCLCWAALAHERRRGGIALLAVAVASQAPVHALGGSPGRGYYAAVSVALLALGAALMHRAPQAQPGDVTGA